MEPISRAIRPRSLSNKSRTATKNLHLIAKNSTSPSSRRNMLSNFSNMMINPIAKSHDFHFLADSEKFQHPMSFRGSHMAQNGSSLKMSPRNTLLSPKTPKVSLRKIINSSSTKTISPRKKIKLLSQVPKASLNIKKTPKVSRPHRSDRAEKSSRNCIDRVTFKTKTGMVNGKAKSNNQDEFFVINHFAGHKNQLLAGVMDGHGIYGHDVSGYVKKQLPISIENNLPYEGKPHIVLSTEETSPDLIEKIKKAMKAGFSNVQKSLVAKRAIDINFSGTTAITVMIRDNLCICSNVGDSRAIIGRFNEIWYPIELSHDHKPNLPSEEQRILDSGGRVEPYQEKTGEFIGPARVWLKHEQLPGLAMSRSFGDLVAVHVGVISEPEVLTHRLTNDDKFLVIASDGVWEFISNHDCVRIVSEFYLDRDIEKAAEGLVKEAVLKWQQEDNIVDDITLVLIFFSH